MQIGNFKLKMTCGACPEQYDVYLDDKQVGYLRLRHGGFRADYVYQNRDEQVYYATPPKSDGIFDEQERYYYLYEAVKALEKRHFEVQCTDARTGWYY